jgi:hypothetical protein
MPQKNRDGILVLIHKKPTRRDKLKNLESNEFFTVQSVNSSCTPPHSKQTKKIDYNNNIKLIEVSPK